MKLRLNLSLFQGRVVNSDADNDLHLSCPPSVVHYSQVFSLSLQTRHLFEGIVRSFTAHDVFWIR